jgi:acetyl esterase/lipase
VTSFGINESEHPTMPVHLLVAASMWVAASGSAAAKPKLDEIPIAAAPVTEDRLPASRVMLPGVSVRTDMVYDTPFGHRPLRLDLYTPTASAQRPLPLLVFVHGGGWTIGHKRATASYADFPGVLASAARRGYVVASVEYRLSGEAPFPGSVQDVKAAVRFLRAQSASLGIDPGRVGLWGGSAGAHLAAMSAFACGETALDPKDKANAGESDCAQAFVGWYGPYDVAQLVQGAAAAAAAAASAGAAGAGAPTDNTELLGGLAYLECTPAGCPPGRLRQASPVAYVDRSDPPSLLIHGTADTLVPHVQTLGMAEALRGAGVPVEVLSIDGVNHGWAGPTPQRTREASLQALEATLAFFDKQLRGTR